MTNPNPSTDPMIRLRFLRIIWGAMLMGELVFAVVVGVILSSGTPPPAFPASRVQIVQMIGVAMVAGGAMSGLVFRKIMFARGRLPNGAVTMESYWTGTLIFMAACEGPAFFGLFCVILTRHWWPSGLMPAVAMALQVLNFPTGSPTQVPPFSDGR